MLRGYEKFLNRIFILIDSITLLGTFILSYYIKFKTGWFGYEPHLPLEDYILLVSAFVPFIIIINYLFNLYSPERGHSFFDEHLTIIKVNLLTLLFVMGILFFIKQVHFSRALLLLYTIINIVLMTIIRYAIRLTLNEIRSSGYNKKYLLIIGAGPLGIAFAEKVRKNKGLGFEILGFLDDDYNKVNKKIDGITVIGNLNSLQTIIESNIVDQVIIALPLRAYDKLQMVIENCERAHIKTFVIPDYFKYLPAKPHIEDFDGIPLVDVWHIPLDDIINYWLKRLFDITISAILIIILAPVMLLTALAIRLDSPGPVIFKQQRIGRNGKIFNMLKFRSMVSDAEEKLSELLDDNEAEGALFKIKEDPRITRVGRFIRRNSIDEVPQIFNVFKGEMSIVGPRPPLPREVEMYKEFQNLRLRSIPGITGLWQISGRSNVSFEEMIRLDIFYIENHNLWMDIKILFKTIPAVIKKEGAY